MDVSAANQRRKIAMVVAFYFVISISVVFMNKFLMVSKEFKFDYPLTITWFQIFVAIICVVTLSKLKSSIPILSFMPTLDFDTEKFKKVAPLTITYIAMLTTTNLCLKYVEVSFYQVARSLTICCNVLFTYTILHQPTSSRALLACAITFVGYVLGGLGEINFSWLGLFYGLASSVALSLNSIVFKKKLAEFNGDEFVILFYNSTLSLFVLAPLVLISGELDEALAVPFLYNPRFLFNMTVTAVLGFLINIAMFLQIKHTSPLTNNISGTAKACVQTLLGVIIFKIPITALNMFGTLVCIAGTAYYGQVRYQEMEEARKKQAAVSAAAAAEAKSDSSSTSMKISGENSQKA